MSPRLLLSGMTAALICLPAIAMAQLPDRRLPPSGENPSVRDPGPGGTLVPALAPQPAVRPGTTLREPVALPSRELVYLAPGEAPGNVQVTVTGPRQVTLSWSATAGASGYWIHRAGPGQTTYFRGGSLVTETTTPVGALLPGTAYSFKVSAVYPQELQRREGLSGAVSATTDPAPAPGGLAASVTGKAQVTLTWDKLAGADWYRLIRNGAALTDIKPFTVTQGGPATLRTTYEDPVGGPGTYLYQIQAVYLADGAQAVSAVVPTPPVGITIKASTRVRYCQTTNARSGCGEPRAAPATSATHTALHVSARNTP